MPWSVAEPIAEPPSDRDHRALEEVDEALLTPWVRGPLRLDRGPSRWVRGAVHRADGSLVEHSQRDWNGDRLTPAAADPTHVRIPPKARRLDGRWIYGGSWDGHFGHLLLETVTTLWPDPAQIGPVAGIVMHRTAIGPGEPAGGKVPLREPDLAPWRRRMLELTGHGGGRLLVVHGRPLRVERLVVPARPLVHKRWVAPPAVELWRRMSDTVGVRGPHRAVYMSRTAFNADPANDGRSRSDPEVDHDLDRRFAAAGFHVAHPETLTIDEQIALVRGADVLAGQAGSALHLAVFTPPGTRVLVLGDSRAARREPVSQQVVDAACGHRTAFVPPGDDAALAAVLAEVAT